MSTRIFGSGIKRREDPRLITGQARYTDDIKLPGVLHMAVVRSPYAHANIVSIDSAAAEAMDGVVAVFTGKDIDLAGIPTAWLIPDSDLKTPEHPALAKGKVRYVGDGRGDRTWPMTVIPRKMQPIWWMWNTRNCRSWLIRGKRPKMAHRNSLMISKTTSPFVGLWAIEPPAIPYSRQLMWSLPILSYSSASCRQPWNHARQWRNTTRPRKS